MSGGGKLRCIAAPLVASAQEQWDKVTRGAGGGLAWPALLRKLDAVDDGYRS